jgi:succinylarginine dihydrolase
VQAGGDANAFQRLVLDEFLADALQHRHGLVGPLNAALAQIGQLNVLDIKRSLRNGGSCHVLLLRCRTRQRLKNVSF